MNSTVIGSIIGIVGIIIGIIISEFVRRKSRIEKFSEIYFTKKIEIYYKLTEDFWNITKLFDELNELDEATEKKMEIWHSSVLDFLSWIDKRFLFLEEDITVHIGTLLISAGDYLNKDSKSTIKDIHSEFEQTKLLIMKSIGLNQIEKKFKETVDTKISSVVIEYYNKLKKKEK